MVSLYKSVYEYDFKKYKEYHVYLTTEETKEQKEKSDIKMYCVRSTLKQPELNRLNNHLCTFGNFQSIFLKMMKLT